MKRAAKMTPLPKKREHRFNCMLSPEEVLMLKWLADRAGLTASDVLRQMLREEYAKR